MHAGRGRSEARPPSEHLIALGSKSRLRDSRQRQNEVVPKAQPQVKSSAISTKSRKLESANVAEDLVEQILSADSTDDVETINALLHEALLFLKSNPLEPDRHCYLSLIKVAKIKPALFATEQIFETLLSFLQRDLAHLFKRNNLLPVLACNLFVKTYNSLPEWPVEFVQVYLADALTDRIWVDEEATQEFVANVLTVFPPPLTRTISSVRQAPPKLKDNEEEDEELDRPEALLRAQGIGASNRYPNPAMRKRVADYLYELLDHHLSLRTDNPRNVIRLLSNTIAYSNSRRLASLYLAEWLENPSAVRFAKELLNLLVLHCNTTSEDDLATLSNILQLKTKGVHIQLYFDAVAALLQNNPQYPVIALRTFIYQEVLPQINNANMKMLGIIFTAIPEHAELELALIFQELAANEEYIPYLRLLLGKVIKAISGTKMDFVAFSQGLLQEQPEMFEQDVAVKERWLAMLSYLVCLTTILAVPTSLLGETSIQSLRDNALCTEFREQVAKVQEDSMVWCHSVVPKYIPSISPRPYYEIIRRLLFLDPIATYFETEIPQDVEKGYQRILCNDIPLLEDTITLITVIHLTTLPRHNADALECLYAIVRRAATLMDGRALHIQNPQLVEALFKLTEFVPPLSDMDLPAVSLPLAVSSCFWQAILILVLVGSFNVQTIGSTLWNNVPSAKSIMEMLITRNWTFPPTFPVPSQAADRVMATEAELQMKEREHILFIENFITKAQMGMETATIDKNNSVLLQQLMFYDPHGTARCPPEQVINQLKYLDAEFRIGHRLCCSRDPDFLQEIMRAQGASQWISWLSGILAAEPDTLEVLPSVCLCELLLSTSFRSSYPSLLPRLSTRLILHMQMEALATIPDWPILEFFLSKLSNRNRKVREVGKKTLSLLLLSLPAPEADWAAAPQALKSWELQERESQWDTYHWLHTFTAFPSAQPFIRSYLLKALHHETHASAVAGYLTYLLTTAHVRDLSVLARELCQMLESRPFVGQRLLQSADIYSLFMIILISAIHSAVEPPQIEETDMVLQLAQPSGQTLFVEPVVLSGCLTLLGHSPPSQGGHEVVERGIFLHSQLVELLFPASGQAKTVALSPSLQALSIPSEKHALAFLTTSHPRLVQIALSSLPLARLMDLLAHGIGLSAASADSALQRLAELLNTDTGSLASISPPLRSLLVAQLRVYASMGCSHAKPLLAYFAGSGYESPQPDLYTFCSSPPSPIIQEGSAPERQLPSFDTMPADPDRAEDLLLRSLSLYHSADSSDMIRTSLPHRVSLLHHLGTCMAVPTHDFPTRVCQALVRCFPRLVMPTQAAQPSPPRFPSNGLALEMAMASVSLVFSHPVRCQAEPSLNAALRELVGCAEGFVSQMSNPLVALVLCYGVGLGMIPLQRLKQPRCDGDDWSTLVTLRSVKQSEGTPHLLTPDALSSALKDPQHIWVGEEIVERIIHRRACATGNISSIIGEVLPLISQKGVSQASLGLLLDWLEATDPAGRHVPVQRWLVSNTTTGYEIKSYIVWLLVHSASWSHLHHYVHSMLNTSRNLTKTGCKQVLDLLTGYLRHPGSWEGAMNLRRRDNRGLRQEAKQATLYQFTPATVAQLSEYILCEGHVDRRKDIFLHAIFQSSENIHAAFHHILGSRTRYPNESNRLLLVLYLHCPTHLRFMPKIVPASNPYDSYLDEVIHNLLQLLLHEDVTLCNCAYNSLRYLTIYHPTLITKNLRSIGCLLSGRVHLTPREFVERRFHRLYAHVLSLLDLLRPAIFQTEEVWEMMVHYFGLLDVLPSSPSQAFVPLINKLVRFLCYAMEAPSAYVLEFLTHQRRHLLLEIQAQFGEITLIERLLDLHASRAAGIEKHEESYEKMVLQPLSGLHIMAAVKSLQGESPQKEETIIGLSVLSTHMPWLLLPFLPELLSFLPSKVSILRRAAYQILLRLLHHDPGQSKAVVDKFLLCIDNEDEEVQREATAQLSEMYPFCQEVLPSLLGKLFRLGVTNADVLPTLMRLYKFKL